MPKIGFINRLIHNSNVGSYFQWNQKSDFIENIKKK